MIKNEELPSIEMPQIDAAGVGVRFGISALTVRRLAARKEISHCRVGGQLRFSDRDIAEYLEKSRVTAFH